MESIVVCPSTWTYRHQNNTCSLLPSEWLTMCLLLTLHPHRLIVPSATFAISTSHRARARLTWAAKRVHVSLQYWAATHTYETRSHHASRVIRLLGDDKQRTSLDQQNIDNHASPPMRRSVYLAGFARACATLTRYGSLIMGALSSLVVLWMRHAIGIRNQTTFTCN